MEIFKKHSYLLRSENEKLTLHLWNTINKKNQQTKNIHKSTNNNKKIDSVIHRQPFTTAKIESRRAWSADRTTRPPEWVGGQMGELKASQRPGVLGVALYLAELAAKYRVGRSLHQLGHSHTHTFARNRSRTHCANVLLHRVVGICGADWNFDCVNASNLEFSKVFCWEEIYDFKVFFLYLSFSNCHN